MQSNNNSKDRLDRLLHKLRYQNGCVYGEQSQLNVTAPNDSASIVIVTYNSAETILDCLNSLSRTLRSYDEVVVVDNNSRDNTREIVRETLPTQSRIKLIENASNRGYSAAANQGAHSTANPFIVFLNPDTLVTPNWLEKLIYHLQPDERAAVGPVSNSVAGLQKLSHYLPKETDRNDIFNLLDKVWELNQKQSCQSKLLIGYCLMIKRAIFDEIGGMDENLFLGNDDLDLSWRLRTAGYELVVAKDTVIFHKGQVSFSTEPEALTSKLIQESTDYLYYKLIRYYGANKVPTSKALWGMDWFKESCKIKSNQPLTSIIILTHNQLHYTKKCIDSLFAHTHSAFELILVDNASTDGTVEYLQGLSRDGTACIRIKLIVNTQNQGFAKGCNQGINDAIGEFLVLLNNDVVVTSGWLDIMIESFSESDKIGLIGPMTNFVSGPQRVDKPNYDIETLEGLETFSNAHALRNKNKMIKHWRIVGFCMLIKRCVIEKIGGLDTKFGLGNFEDDDFCLRAHIAGFGAGIASGCYVHHYGKKTFNGLNIDYENRMKENWEIFKAKWEISDIDSDFRSYKIGFPPEKFCPIAHVISLEGYKKQMVADR